MQKKLSYWLAAAHAENITPRQILKWLEYVSDIQVLLSASESQLRDFGLTQVQAQSLINIDRRQVDQSLVWAERDGCHLLTLDDSDYPHLLKEISDPPLVLFVKGNKDILRRTQIGIVGARHVSTYGEKNARQFARVLSEAGLVVTSGMAIGVDAASHLGAIAGNGLTIAVTGTGMNHIYPPRHRGLAAQIIEHGGALVSEFPLDMQPKPYHFPRRNRVISGLSCGVLVVEAALRSGSLVTARHALEQGRDVFAIPGSINSSMARGCHALIRQGAKLVETAEDVLEEFAGKIQPIQVEFSKTLAIMPESLTMEEQKIHDTIRGDVTSVDEIILRSGLTAGAVSSILLSLELRGHIHSVAGGYVR
ncbi:MAG TPA: DNA-processing protein DprA [Anaerolineae bacterium]|nr:DNA-processing protein DprA [Anaerolineae bacterium]